MAINFGMLRQFATASVRKPASHRPQDFDPVQLARGTRVEMEHTRSKWIARRIAMDHLSEDPAYYEKLAMMHLDGLGVSQTYVDAQRIVTALERAQQDPTYFDSAIEILNAYVEPERTEVINKAIALGADPQIVRSLAQSGEVIEIVGSAPVIKIGTKRFRLPLLAIGGGILAIIVGAFAYKKWRVGKSIV